MTRTRRTADSLSERRTPKTLVTDRYSRPAERRIIEKVSPICDARCAVRPAS